MLDWLGWLATAIFAGSYFCKRTITLRLTQAVAAVVWMGYGIIIHALPIIVANISVVFMASYSAWRERCQKEQQNTALQDVAGSTQEVA